MWIVAFVIDSPSVVKAKRRKGVARRPDKVEDGLCAVGMWISTNCDSILLSKATV